MREYEGDGAKEVTAPIDEEYTTVESRLERALRILSETGSGVAGLLVVKAGRGFSIVEVKRDEYGRQFAWSEGRTMKTSPALMSREHFNGATVDAALDAYVDARSALESRGEVPADADGGPESIP